MKKHISLLEKSHLHADLHFAATYTNSLSLIYSVLGDNIKNGTPSIASLVKGSSKVWQRAIDTLYGAFEKLDK